MRLAEDEVGGAEVGDCGEEQGDVGEAVGVRVGFEPQVGALAGPAYAGCAGHIRSKPAATRAS